jgi:tetratricopeptide (TPR) repeat protein
VSELLAALRALKRGDRAAAERALAGELTGEVAEAWLLRGILRRRLDEKSVHADLRQGIALGPTDAGLLAQAAEILLADRLVVDARNALARLAELVTPAESARVRRRLANLELDLGRYREGIAEYRRALELTPDTEPIGHELANHLRELGDFEAALELFERFGERPPEVLVKLGRFDEARHRAREIARNQPDLAAAELLILTGAFDEAKELLGRERDRRPDDVRPVLLLADLAAWSGDHPRAHALVADALRLDSESLTALRIRATLHLLAGNAEAGERDLERVLSRDPNDALALVWRGEAERRRQHWESSWADLGRGIERTRGYPIGAHVTLVATHAGRDFAGALDPDLYRELCQILTPLFAILGEGTEAPRSNQEVSQRLEAVLEVMHGNRGPRPSYVHEGALKPLDLPMHARFQARALQELLRTRPASHVLSALQALALERPTESTIHCHIGEVHLWLGDYDAAEKAFLAAIELARDTRWAYVGLCATELGRNHPEEAIAWCERGEKEAMPGRTQFAYRGEAHRRLGDRVRALADLDKAIELTPTRLSAWINLALVDREPTVLATTFREVARQAPGLVDDASSELGLDARNTAEDPSALVQLFEHVLGMMRGNRASSFVTYFTKANQLRFVPPPGSEEAKKKA